MEGANNVNGSSMDGDNERVKMSGLNKNEMADNSS